MLQWYELVAFVESLHLSNEEDTVIWKLESKGIYTTRSIYAFVNLEGLTLLMCMQYGK